MTPHYSLKTFLVAAIVFLCASPSQAAQTYFYESFTNSGTSINTFFIRINDFILGKRKVLLQREAQNKDIEQYVLDEDYATVSWQVTNTSVRTSYFGQREGDTIIIQGRLEGSSVNLSLTIDEKPFYFNPKLGLMQFVRSGHSKSRFWTLRHDNLDPFILEAKNKGEEVIDVNGHNTVAVRVDWTIPGWRSVFFKRTYWFRKSDGIYVKQLSNDGTVRVLIREE